MRKQNIFKIFILLIFIGCQREIPLHEMKLIESDFQCEDMNLVRNYTIECIKAAGQSGESEPEDWLSECVYISKEMYCKKESFIITYLVGDETLGMVELKRELYKK